MSSHPRSPEGTPNKRVRINNSSDLSVNHVTPMSAAPPVAEVATVATDMAAKRTPQSNKNTGNGGVQFYSFSNADNEKITAIMDQVEKKSQKQDIATSTSTPPSTVESRTSMYDPRGFPFSETMPRTYCLDCRCPSRFCHDNLFGHYLECEVVNEVAMKTVPLLVHQVKSIYNRHYTALLRFKIFEMEGVLDKAVYELPDCIVTRSLESSLKYLRHRTYHIYMRSCIVNGRGHKKVVEQKEEDQSDLV
jgi:hypothetical protein